MIRTSSFVLAVGLLIANTPVVHAGEPTKIPELQLQIEQSVVEGEDIRRWFEQDTRALFNGLQEKFNGSTPAKVAIQVTGRPLAYRIEVWGIDADGKVLEPKPEPIDCKCSSAQVVERTLPTISALTMATEAQQVTEPAPAPAASDDASRKPRTIGPMGGVGIGVLALGVLTLAAGLPVVLTRDSIDPSIEAEDTASTGYRAAVIGTAVAGGVLVAAGASLLTVDVIRNKRRLAKISATPRASRSYAGALVTLNF